mgnify:CR=1 FL=1
MNLKEIRSKRNMTQQMVADYIGCSSVVYSRYERGTRQPSIEMLLKLSDLFGVTIDFLLGRQALEDSTLFEYEKQLVLASRNADERAKDDALQMLLSHSINQ